MAKYRIVSATPKKASNHLHATFKLYKLDEQRDVWTQTGWRSIHDVSDLIRAGHEVRTGKVAGGKMNSGAAVELELRIAKNDTNYKISEMPDT